MREFKINSNDAGQRLDKFVLKTVKGIPLSLVYKSIRTKKIKVNRKRAEQNQMLSAGDTVQMFLNENLFGNKISSSEYMNVKPRLDIIYEDDNIILCDKAPGVLVHTGDGDGKISGDGASDDRNTLIYYIQAYLTQKGEFIPEEENSFAPALCNRIDRNTGGIVIAAKNATALRDINARIKNNYLKKYYLCAVHGKMQKENDTLSDFLIKDSNKNIVKIIKNKVACAKNIVTRYKLISYNEEKNISLLEVGLETGRTHQIRAHLSHIGHPLLGDGKYGNIEYDKKYGYKHQALYSYKLRFDTFDDSVSYLNGKEFKVAKERVYFLREFHNL